MNQPIVYVGFKRILLERLHLQNRARQHVGVQLIPVITSSTICRSFLGPCLVGGNVPRRLQVRLTKA